MPHTRRPMRFLTSIALAGVLAGTTLAPAPLSATTPTLAERRAAFCSYVARAVALLQAQRPGPLRDFLLAQLLKLEGSYCS